jgi:sugar phosphate isomerase/epimerase
MSCPLLGLSSSYFAFRGKGLYDSVKSVFDLGFETAELGAGHRFEPNAWKTVRRIKRDFPEKNYTIHSLFPPPKERFWFNPSLGLNKQNKETVGNLFKAAQIVEAKVVGIHPGFLNELGWGYDSVKGFDTLVPGKALDAEKSWRNFTEVIQYGLKLSQETGVVLAIENIHGAEARPIVLSVEDFGKVFALFPELRLLFDFGHALFEGRADELVAEFGERIAEVHLHWSERKSSTHLRDDHSPIVEEKQLQLFGKAGQIRRVPIIFEHGTNVGEQQILREKELVECFLKKIK